jgi:glycosyltransferase involved in cell wall biosynthesis
MKQPERILHFGIKYYPSQGGSSRVAELLVQKGKPRADVSIYCYRNQRFEPAHWEGVHVIQVPDMGSGSLGVFLYYALCCLHVLLFGKYDLIHVHKTDSAFFIPLLKLKARVIATSQEAPYRRDKWSWLGKLYFRLMEKIFMHSGAVLTAVSLPLKQYYEQRYQRNVHFVPNFVDTTPVYDDAGAEELMLRHHISPGFLLFSARRIMSTKGCHTLMAALRQINYKGQVVIIGQDSHAPEYSHKLRKLADGLQVIFTGYVGTKPILMSMIRKSRLFLFPSENEGMSLMLLEAASTVTPIVASDIPENTSVFTDEEVLFFQDKSADDLALRLQFALSNPNEMAIRANRAIQRVKNNYSAHTVAEQYFELYHDTQVMV